MRVSQAEQAPLSRASQGNLLMQSDHLTETRDGCGRWRQGTSGNPAGRPRGSKNRFRRVRGDLERAAHWTRHDWQAFYNRMLDAAHGDLGQKRAAADSEAIALWRLRYPPVQRPGLCCHCGKPLDVPLSSINGAPIRADGAWVHWGCFPWFQQARWHAAKDGLRRLGVPVGDC